MARAVDGTTQAALDKLQGGINNDPDIQALLQKHKAQLEATRDQGGDARKFQNSVRDQIVQIAEAKGYIPEKGQYFINPNDGQLEPHGGWSGLSKKTKAAIVAAAAVGTWGATGFAGAGALGMGGGGAAAVPTVAGTGTGVGTGAVATGAGVGGGIWDALKNNVGTIFGAGGRMMGSAAEASANNRGVKLDASMEANKLNQQAYRDWYGQMLEREQEGRTGRNDSWKALQQGSYVADWKKPTQSFSPYTRELVGPSDMVREGGAARAADARTRLTGYTMPTPERQSYTLDPKLLEGDMWEKIMGYAGAGTELAGSIMNRRAPTAPVARPQVMPTTSGSSFIDPSMIGGSNTGWADEMRRRGTPVYF